MKVTEVVYIMISLLVGVSNCFNWFHKCSLPKTVENFQLNKIIGSWFIYLHSQGTLIDHFKCMKTIYKPTEEPNAVIASSIAWSFYTKWLNYSAMNYNEYESQVGILSTMNKNEQSIDLWNENINYYIIDTDYESYLIGYFCSYKYFGLASEHNYYVLTKNKEIEANLEEKIKNDLDTIIPKGVVMKKTDFIDCHVLK